MFDSSIKVGGIVIHEVRVLIQTPFYLPNIKITAFFPLDPKTGLFYDDADKITCNASPYGFQLFTGFDGPPDTIVKNIKPGNESFTFRQTISVRGGDAKATVGDKGATMDFSLPTYTFLVRVWGEIYYTGYKWGQHEVL